MFLFRRAKRKSIRKPQSTPDSDLEPQTTKEPTIHSRILEQTKQDLAAEQRTSSGSKKRLSFSSDDEDDEVDEIDQPPAWTARLRANTPPPYRTYDSTAETEYPDFDEAATQAALYASHPPAVRSPNGLESRPEDVEEEQGVYLKSIMYGDQLKRGLNELERFREELEEDVGQQKGWTKEDIARKRRLNQLAEPEVFVPTEAVEEDIGDGDVEEKGQRVREKGLTH
ncbi:hypothetical protein M011DRAFT_463405 [Sporormia fimetaria CBS 119925]|uniref:Uncharacterized protein n=1 Tax=Sporormia fimetaria CBS 119925 TaxID=1340428 RepID=A0A6A6VQ22_9PLEO|nr:hypothetical protein M011DRAFT_463405 [Sporormia fimetaria CBS 119925]